MRPTLIALCLAPALSSCAAAVVAAGAAVGYVQYDRNEAWRDFEASPDDVWKASLAAVHATGLAVPAGVQLGSTEGEIEVDDLHLRVERHPGDFVRVRVRYGTFDTEDHRRRARLLLEDIAARL